MTTILPLAGIEAAHVDDLVRPISPLRDVRAFWRIYRALRRWQPEIVHTHMAKAGAIGRLAALAYNRTRGPGPRARLVHTYHGHVFEGYFGSPSTRLFLAIERWLARRTDALIAISPQVRQELLDTYRVGRESQIRLIPLGFNLERLLALTDDDRKEARAALEIPEQAIVVTTVGRLTPIKQHSLFLETAARLRQRSDRFVFLVVGDGELRSQLHRTAERLGIESRVRFLGWRGDLQTIYGATDVFVLTSRNEGTPVALIEAMAAATASVSTDVGGVRDVIATPEAGTLVAFGDVSALVEAVMRFAESPTLRAGAGSAAREVVRRRFELKRLHADITRLYHELLADDGNP